MLILPGAHLAAGLIQHERSDGSDEAVLLGGGDELHRGDEAPGGVCPAHEGLHSLETPVGEVEGGLVVEDELAAGDGSPEVVVEGEAFDERGAHGRFKYDAAVLAAPFGHVHRHIGVA